MFNSMTIYELYQQVFQDFSKGTGVKGGWIKFCHIIGSYKILDHVMIGDGPVPLEGLTNAT